MTAKTFTPEQLRTFRPRFASGHGSVPIFGNPDQGADQIAAFARAGFAGITISFVDFIGELEYFVAEVLPRLAALGVRGSAVPAVA